MAAQKRERIDTVPGMGAVADTRPLSLRDTLPAPASGEVTVTDSGARRIPSGSLVHRDTAVGLAPASAPPVAPSAPPESAPPVSGIGRYSAKPIHDDVILPPPSQPLSKAPKRDTIRRPERNALRVDEVGTTSIVARQEGKAKPRIVTRVRRSHPSLDSQDRSLLALIERPVTVPDLVRAAGMPEHEVTRTVARLVRLGVLTCSG